MITRINLDMVQGLPFTFYIPVDGVDGFPIDATGDTFTAIMGTYGGTTIVSFTTDYTVDDNGDPALQLTLSSAQTLAINPGIYRWDGVTYDAATGDTLPVAAGEVSVLDFLSA